MESRRAQQSVQRRKRRRAQKALQQSQFQDDIECLLSSDEDKNDVTSDTDNETVCSNDTVSLKRQQKRPTVSRNLFSSSVESQSGPHSIPSKNSENILAESSTIHLLQCEEDENVLEGRKKKEIGSLGCHHELSLFECSDLDYSVKEVNNFRGTDVVCTEHQQHKKTSDNAIAERPPTRETLLLKRKAVNTSQSENSRFGARSEDEIMSDNSATASRGEKRKKKKRKFGKPLLKSHNRSLEHHLSSSDSGGDCVSSLGIREITKLQDEKASGGYLSLEASEVTDVEQVVLPDSSLHNVLQPCSQNTFRNVVLEEPSDIEDEYLSGNEDIDDVLESRNLPAAMTTYGIPAEVPTLPSSPPKIGSRTDEDESDDKPPGPTLREELAKWAAKTLVSHAAVDGLLQVLRSHGHPELPKNAKTLLKTPRSSKNLIKELGGGEYWYGGILSGVKSRLSLEEFRKIQGHAVSIDIFVDGISPYQSIRKTVVALAGCVEGKKKKTFEIALWCGKKHEPDNVEHFFEDFINEFNELMEKGFVIDGLPGTFSLVLKRVIGDAPARAWFLQYVMHPHAYYCCERCCLKGRRMCYRTLFDPREEATLRTDETLASQTQVEHHVGVSPLLKIGLKLLSQCPIEPMHSVYLGGQRRFFQYLFKSKKSVSKIRLQSSVLEVLSEALVSLKPYYVSEFNRQLRPLSEWTTYKASELRRLCLYDCFHLLPLLKNSKIAKVHSLFACGIRILEDKDLVEEFFSDADRLLRNFVTASRQLFGEFFVVFNIHCLTHLADDAACHGTLMDFSAWKYESYLGQIKKTLRAPGKTLQQIVRRLLEKRSALSCAKEADTDAVQVSRPHAFGPIVHRSDEQFQCLSVRDLGVFRTTSPNDVCFVSNDGEVCVARNITRNSKGDINVVYNGFLEKDEYFDYPFSSLAFGICKVKKLGPLKTLPVNAMKHKAVLLPANKADIQSEPTSRWMNNIECLCLPMLHHIHDLSEMTDQ